MLIFLTTLLATLSSICRSCAALQVENVALRHQIGVLRRSLRKRPKLTPVDRLLWVWLSRIWRDWRSALAIVKPETVVACWTGVNGQVLNVALGQRLNEPFKLLETEVSELSRRALDHFAELRWGFRKCAHLERHYHGSP
jgi:hypothetical protein